VRIANGVQNIVAAARTGYQRVVCPAGRPIIDLIVACSAIKQAAAAATPREEIVASPAV
jgi:hypothetical protein